MNICRSLQKCFSFLKRYSSYVDALKIRTGSIPLNFLYGFKRLLGEISYAVVPRRELKVA